MSGCALRRPWLLALAPPPLRCLPNTRRLRVHASGRGQDASADPYTVLGVSRGSSAADVRARYLQQIKEVHPDVSLDPDADTVATQLNLAYAAVMEELASGLGGANSEESLLDVFDRPEAAPTELFVDPFRCYGASPWQWAELQEVAALDPGDPEGALRRAGAAPAEGFAVCYLTPRQLALVVAELEGMGADATSIQVAASYVGTCLLRARVANNRWPN